MLEIGIRYRPLAAADQEVHEATVALLTRDLASCNPDALGNAAEEWVRNERFMPKTADLLRVIRKQAPRPGETDQYELARQANVNLAMNPHGRRDIRWIVSGGSIRLESIA